MFFSFKKKKKERGSMLHALNQLSTTLENKLESGDFKLPVLPIVATKVIGMAANPNTDLEEMSNLIHQDQALAGHVLRISNSALFSVKDPIRSLKEAIGRLGLSMVSEVAAVISIQGQVFQVPQFEEEVERVWLHALVSAYFGKEIAYSLNESPDAQFMCGLLHTVGKPILYQMISDEAGGKLLNDGPNYASQDLVKRLHAYAGSIAAKHWNLPEQVLASCAYYHCRFDTKEYRREIGMTYLSSKLAEWSLTTNQTLADRLKLDSVLKELEIDQEGLHSLFSKSQEILTGATSLTNAL